MPRRTPQKETGGAGRKRRSLPPTDASAIAVLRVALDVPQNEVAGDLGVSPGIVSDLEGGRRTLHSARKDEILDVLSLPPEALGEAEAFVLSIRAKAQADGRSRSGEEPEGLILTDPGTVSTPPSRPY
jgi:transcriptional regulator with XRE-family HTH domain